MNYAKIVKEQMARHGVRQCKGGCACRSSHKRGFATCRDGTIHLSRTIATIKGIWTVLHELGHILYRHNWRDTKRWEREAIAESYAIRIAKILGIRRPRTRAVLMKDYISRMKYWGRNISRARKTRGKK